MGLQGWVGRLLGWVGRLRLSQLVMIVAVVASVWLTLVYVITSRVMERAREGSAGSRGYGARGGALHDRVPDSYIDGYLRALRDTRPARCLVIKYNTKPPGGVSIILHYNEDEFYQLKVALRSIVSNTPDALYTEIVLVDDGSVKRTVALHALQFLQRPEYKKVRQFRSESPGGAGFARGLGAGLARGAIVVFVSGDAVVNRGWLPPLLAAVVADRRQVVAAHTDNFLSEFRFFATPDDYVNVFTWSLSTVFLKATVEGAAALLTTATPVMTGDVYAVDKAFLAQLGGHDAAMVPASGGDAVELSLRAWLCGGGVRIARCSRVAVQDAMRPRHTTSDANFRRTVELWLDGYKHFAYSVSGVSQAMEDRERQSLRTRRAELRSVTGECHPFSWYMQHMGGDLVVPTDRVRRFGKLKALSGYCVHPAATSSIGAVELVLCRPHMYERQLIFELDSAGILTNLDGSQARCLRPDDVGHRLRLRECDVRDPRQTWTLFDDGRLTNRALQDLCLTHVRSPTHHATLQACRGEREQQWTFIKY